ncbi:hypothetical protein F5Y10DRAFT_124686 [Nemania abortiva]|nr:hypothetical protein F5Y10DRAFT_124686 [Nemania abortiva]
MSLTGLTAFRSFVIIMAYNGYLILKERSSVNPNVTNTATAATASTIATTATTAITATFTPVAPTPSTVLTATGLHEPSTGVPTAYNPDAFSLYTFVQCFIAFQMLILYATPFWDIINTGFGLRSFLRNVFVNWSLAFVVYVVFLVVERQHNLAAP